MSRQTSNTLLSGFSRRSLARIVYLGAFVLVDATTSVFSQYPLLFWAAVAGLVLVFFDAVICARRRWRAIRADLASESQE